jgi:hypothetical protein
VTDRMRGQLTLSWRLAVGSVGGGAKRVDETFDFLSVVSPLIQSSSLLLSF